MRSQTTCSVTLFSSVYIQTAGLSSAGLSEIDCRRSASKKASIASYRQEYSISGLAKKFCSEAGLDGHFESFKCIQVT